MCIDFLSHLFWQGWGGGRGGGGGEKERERELKIETEGVGKNVKKCSVCACVCVCVYIQREKLKGKARMQECVCVCELCVCFCLPVSVCMSACILTFTTLMPIQLNSQCNTHFHGRCVNRQTKTSVTVYRSSSNFPNSGGVGNPFFFSSAIFLKKAENHLKKSGRPEKKRNSAEKRKIDNPA